MRGYVGPRFDFSEPRAVERVLIIASSYRCGSTYLSAALWADGRFGAPFEYLNFEKHMDVMMARLGAEDIDEYLRKIVRLRTSPNGVFSVKAHFHHFNAAVQRSSAWNNYLEGAEFLYVDRKDKIAQAVSMARALQDNAWTSFEGAHQVPLFYSKEFIDACLKEVMDQTQAWWRWFEMREIQPYIADYETFRQDMPHQVADIADWFGVPSDEPHPVKLPMTEQQADQINRQWIERFVAESKEF